MRYHELSLTISERQGSFWPFWEVPGPFRVLLGVPGPFWTLKESPGVVLPIAELAQASSARTTVCVIKIFHDLNEYNSTDIRKIPFLISV